MRRVHLLCLSLLLAACPSADVDEDGDGSLAEDDCDDANADVFPGASERCNAIDDDCDGAIDEEPVDGITGYADVDEDGFGDPSTAAIACTLAFGRVLDATDCDDTAADVNPDEDELCDTVDHDCDGDATAGAVDPSTWYADADEDQFGDAADSEVGCMAPDGYVTDDTDCDDTRTEVNPGATEVDCNGLDDDCDEDIDVNSVPNHHATIQDAVDALPDGSTVCLQAATYTEQLDLTGRELTFVGATGAAGTIFDIGTDLPLISADSWDEGQEVVEGTPGSLTFVGITVTGSPFTTTDGVDGGFLYVGGGAARLEDVVVTGVHPRLEDGADARGLLALVEGGSVEVEGLEVTDVSWAFGDSTGSMNIDGGVLASDNGDLDITDATAVGLTLSTPGVATSCYVRGLFAYVDNGALDLSGVSVTDGTATQSCSTSSYLHGYALHAGDADTTFTNVTLSGNAVTVSSSSSAYAYGLVETTEGEHDWSVIDVSDNTITTTNDTSSSYAYGVLDLEGVSFALSHATIVGNTVRAEVTGTSTSGYAYSAGLNARGPFDGDHLDVRRNALFGARHAEGGGIRWREDGDFPGASSFTNFIVAGNTAEADVRAFGGGMSVVAEDDHLFLAYGDIVGNNVVGGDESSHGGGLYDDSEEGGGSVGMTGLNVVNNAATSPGTADVEGEGVFIGDDDAPRSWTYNNVWGPANVHLIQGMADPTGSDGNISADPLYTAQAGDASTWDLTLPANSPSTGAANPSQQNADGSAASIGAYGGPDAAWP